MNIKKIKILMAYLRLLSIFIMIGCDSRTESSSQDELFVIFPNNRYGCMDRKGNVIIPTRFDFAGDCSEGLMPVKEKGKWGVINAEGDYIIPPTFQFIRGPFSKGLICAMKDYKFGFIDQKGQWAIEPIFEHDFAFNELGMAEVMMNREIGFINTQGEYLIKPAFDRVGEFSNGLAPVKKKATDKWGFIDTNGNMVIQPQFDYAESFSEGLTAVEKSGKVGFIDPTGKLVLDYKYDATSGFSQGLAGVEIKGRWGYINTKGDFVIPANFSSGTRHSEGYAAVEVNSLYGFIDRKGKFIIKPRFMLAVSSFENGLVLVGLRINGQYLTVGYVDPKGNVIKQWEYSPDPAYFAGNAPVNPDAEPGNSIAVPENQEFIDVGGDTGIAAPNIIIQKKLEYPQELQAKYHDTAVVLKLEVDIYGRVTSAKAIQGPKELWPTAEKYALSLVFEPTIIDGEPYYVKFEFTLHFQEN